MFKITKYPDGSSYATVDENLTELCFRVNSYEDLWHLTQICDAAAKPLNITIPCLFDAQADRRFEDNQSMGVKLVLRHLKMLSETYKAKFYIFHPHNAEVVMNIMGRDAVVVDNYDFMCETLSTIMLVHNLVMLSPDAGAYKWINKTANKLQWEGEVMACSKARSWDSLNKESKFVQQLPVQDFQGKDILIVDDLCINGGTFKGLATLLDKANVGKKYLAVSHITIQNHKKDSVFDYFDRVFTTNSKYDDYWVNGGEGGVKPENLSVFKMFNC